MCAKHIRNNFMRVICSNGSTQIREICPECWANVRGGGNNVPHGELFKEHGKALEDCAILEDHRPRCCVMQPSLF